jgi:hypothetical protein
MEAGHNDRVYRRGRPFLGHTFLDRHLRWFAEGFDTGDLKDAKALLGELSEWWRAPLDTPETPP